MHVIERIYSQAIHQLFIEIRKNKTKKKMAIVISPHKDIGQVECENVSNMQKILWGLVQEVLRSEDSANKSPQCQTYRTPASPKSPQ